MAAVVLGVAAVPLLAMIHVGTRESSASENALFAEGLSARAIQQTMAPGWDELARKAPFEVEVPPGAGPPEYEARFKGPSGFQTRLRVFLVRPGLLALEAVSVWREFGRAGERRYALLRLFGRPDLSLTARHRLQGGGSS